MYEEGLGSEPGIKLFGEVLTTQKVKRGSIPVASGPDTNPEEICYYFSVREWKSLPEVIAMHESFEGKPQFTNKFLLDHCTEYYQLFSITSAEEYRLMTEINRAFTTSSAKTSAQNEQVYHINENLCVIASEGCITIANNNGDILKKIPMGRFARTPRSEFRKIKELIQH